MKGWTMNSDRKIVATTNHDEMATFMPFLKKHIERIASGLDATLEPDEFNRRVANYNEALGWWNDNAALLERRRIVDEVRQITASLRWPPDEEASEASAGA